jgi:pimeloyl-ACP methyl ester carboxylesterase
MAVTGATSVLQISDNLSLRYLKAGNGPPLVLLHTIRTQLEYFRELIPKLTKNFTVYAVDLPGHGHSPIDPGATYDEPYFRTAIVGFFERLDLRDVTLVGESIGGVLALTVAATIPKRIRAVFSLNPYDYETRYGDGVRRGNLFASLIIGSFGIPVIGAINAALENRLFLGIILGGGFHDRHKLPADLLKEFDRVGRRSGYRSVERKTFSGWRSWAAAQELYRKVKAPVTLIYGEEDWSRTPERQRAGAQLDDARMITLQKTGHFSCLESPREVAGLILKPPR